MSAEPDEPNFTIEADEPPETGNVSHGPHYGKPTRRMDPRELARQGEVSWPLAIAALERLGPHFVLALRLGVLALVQECTRAMTSVDAPPDLVEQMRCLTDALAHMPWEGPR